MDCKPSHPPEIVITIIHGTWGRGVFPKLGKRLPHRGPFWFEAGSNLRAALENELASTKRTFIIEPFLWSGANSIYHRDSANISLKDRLAYQHKEFPEAIKLVIAHSHGGNIALRSTRSLRGIDVKLVTLATPFVEVLSADLSQNLQRKIAAAVAITGVSIAIWLGHISNNLSWSNLALALPLLGIIGWWVGAVTFTLLRSDQRRAERLAEASRLPKDHSALLILRTVDDEASLFLAAGAFGNRLLRWLVGAISIAYSQSILVFLASIVSVYALVIAIFLSMSSIDRLEPFVYFAYYMAQWTTRLLQWIADAIFLISAFFIILLMLSCLCKVGYGREFIIPSFYAEINSQSVPDAAIHSGGSPGCSSMTTFSVITLNPASSLSRIRHSIYNHPSCAKAIVDWICAT